MWMQWGQQRQYVMNSWQVGWMLGNLFVITNLFGQLIPCGMILTKKKTDLACGILMFTIALQVRNRMIDGYIDGRKMNQTFFASRSFIVSFGNHHFCFGKSINSMSLWRFHLLYVDLVH